jgi:hypothetical protein
MTTKTAVFTTIPFNGVPAFTGNNIDEWTLKAKNTINNNLNGKLNSTGTFTLAASTVSTEVKFANGMVGENTVLIYFPLTANAATVWGAGTMFMSSRDVPNSVLGLTHASDANTDKTFAYVLIG